MSDDLHSLFPHLSDAELAHAQANLRAYLALVIRMYERIKDDSVFWHEFCTLTGKNPNPKIRDERSNDTNPTLKTYGP
jgi:hypothetical protein